MKLFPILLVTLIGFGAEYLFPMLMPNALMLTMGGAFMLYTLSLNTLSDESVSSTYKLILTVAAALIVYNTLDKADYNDGAMLAASVVVAAPYLLLKSRNKNDETLESNP